MLLETQQELFNLLVLTSAFSIMGGRTGQTGPIPVLYLKPLLILVIVAIPGRGKAAESGRIFFFALPMSHNSFRFTVHMWPPSRPGSFHPWCRLGKVGSGKLIKAD